MPSWVDIRYINQTYALRRNFQELVLDINKCHDGCCNKQTLPHFQAIANSVELILNKCLNIPKTFHRQLFNEFSKNVMSNLALIQMLDSQNSFTLIETTSSKCNQFRILVIDAYDRFIQFNKSLEAKKTINNSPAKVIYDSPLKPESKDEIKIGDSLLSQETIIKVIAQWRYIPLKNLKCTDKIAHLFYHYSKPMMPNKAAFYYLLSGTGMKLLKNEEQKSWNDLILWAPPVILFGIGACLLLLQKCQENPRLPKQKDEKLTDVESPSSGYGESYKRLSPYSMREDASPPSVTRALSFGS